MAGIDSAAVELAGRNWLVVQLLRRSIESAVPVIDRGIDLIAFREIGTYGIKVLPLQLKCAASESFSLDRKYEGRGIPLIYIWNVFDMPTAFMLTYDEALGVLGESASTPSWTEGGKYIFTRMSVDLRHKLKPFIDRWAWLEGRLIEQPVSG